MTGDLRQEVKKWRCACSVEGMRQRGYSLIELLIGLGIIGVVSAISIPLVLESSRRSELWAGSERMGALVRQARLRAISQNANYRVVFNCPAANQARALVLTGDAAIDGAADRCSTTMDGDGEVVYMPSGVTVDPSGATELRVTPRGVFSAVGDAIPLTITVAHGGSTRTVAVSATGQITYGSY